MPPRGVPCRDSVTAEAVFGNGDLVEVDTTTFCALARVRLVDGRKLHVALEQGGYLPWVDSPVQVRLFQDAAAVSHTARILHCGSVTALLELDAPEASEGSAAPPLPRPPSSPDAGPDLGEIDSAW